LRIAIVLDSGFLETKKSIIRNRLYLIKAKLQGFLLGCEKNPKLHRGELRNLYMIPYNITDYLRAFKEITAMKMYMNRTVCLYWWWWCGADESLAFRKYASDAA